MTSPIIYLIRHGEKPPKDSEGDDVQGLSAEGLKRAQWLRQVFSKTSPYNIKYILAEHPKKDGARARPLETITPLASDLGLMPDTSVARNDAKSAAVAAKAFRGPGNVLICWEHGQLSDIARALGVQGEVEYPGERFDLIWKVPEPYTRIENVISEGMPGIDDRV